MIRLLLFPLFLFTIFSYTSQVLNGKVIDQDSLEVPFAKIRIQNQSYGTVANASGNFQLELKKGKYILVFSAMDYETRIDTVEITEITNYYLAVLSEKVINLEEVVIIAKSDRDKGKEVMKKAIEKRPFFQNLLSEYSCETYCFSTLEKDKLDSLIKDSVVGKDKLNLIEWRAKTYYKRALRFKDEFYAYNDFVDNNKSYTSGVSTTIGVDATVNGGENSIAVEGDNSTNPYLFVNGIKEAHFSIFDNSINAPKLTENPIVSPLSDNAFFYYNFYFVKAFVDSSKNLINEINVKPKFDHEALFDGTIYIRHDSWEVVSYDLKINPAVLNYFKDLHIVCDYQKKGECLVPVRREFVYNIKEGKTIINGLIRVSHSDYQFKVNDSTANFWLETSVYKEDAFDKDSSYWNEVRPFTLKDFEKQFIKDQDSIIAYHESEEYYRKQDSLRNQIRFLDVLFNGVGHVNSFKKYEFGINGLISQIVPFGVGGYRHRLEVYYQKEFKNGKIINVSPMIDYGFYNKDLKESFAGSIMYNRLNFSKIGFQVGDVYDFVSGAPNYQGVLAPANRVRNQKISVDFSREIINGLYVKSGLSYSDRQSISGIVYPSWVNVFGKFQTPQEFNRYKILLGNIDLEYHFRQKFAIKKNKKIVYGSIWPVLFLKYKMAVPGVFSSEANFDFLEFQATHTIKLKSFGNSNFRFVAGSYLHKKDLRIIEHKYFRPSDRGYFSNPVYSLQLLDTAMNTSNSYLQFNFIHHFNGFFLNKIWLINKLKLEETIGGSFLSIPNSHFAQAEFYVGIERKIRIRKEIFKLGIYAVTQDNSFTGSSVKFKFGINFYNVFRDKWEY